MKGDGLWAVLFFSLPGHGPAHECSGILRLSAGQIFGGDAWSLYSGTYEIEGNLVLLSLGTRSRSAGSGQSIFGDRRGEMSFMGTGLIDGEEKTIDAVLTAPANRNLNLMARLSSICALPELRGPSEPVDELPLRF